MIEPGLACTNFVASITDWMDGALEPPVRNSIEQHLLICPGCSEYLEQLRLALDVVKRMASPPAEAPPPAARDALLAMFRRERVNGSDERPDA